MLGSDGRLKKDRDFRRVMAAGNKTLYGPLLIFSAPSEADRLRFGVVVSKKVSAKAVERNKIRRQLSHLLRPVAETLPIKEDVVIVVLRPAEFSQYEIALQAWQKKQ